MIEKSKGFFCSNRDRRFALWKENRYLDSIGKKMIKQIVEELLNTSKASLRRCRSRKYGKTYDATLLPDTDDKGQAVFHAEFPDRKRKRSDRIRPIEKVRSEMDQTGSKIMKWDEINGREEEIAEPHITPKDRMEEPEVSLGNDYLKAAEEQIKDDYDFIDDIVNNEKRGDTDGRAESERMSTKEELREQEGKLRTRPTEPPHREKDPLCPDRNLC